MEQQIPMPDDVAAVVSMGALPADRCFFRAALFWQPIMDLHVCDGGLDFKIDIEGGSKRARLPVGKSHPNFSLEDNPGRLADAIKKQTSIVRDSEARNDAASIRKLLATAATWGDAPAVAAMLRTCYVTESAALPSLAAAVESGHTAVVRVLLDAGVSPTTVVPGRPGGKNPLHVACEAGQEEVAMMLLGSTASLEDVGTPDGNGRSPAALLRQMDMGGTARRFEAAAAVRFAGDDNTASSEDTPPAT